MTINYKNLNIVQKNSYDKYTSSITITAIIKIPIKNE